MSYIYLYIFLEIITFVFCIALDYSERLKRHSAVLKSRLECQPGLLDSLLSRLALTDEQVADVKRPQTTSFEQNARLLELMCQKEDIRHHQAFLDSLTETGQRHLAAYIINDGGYNKHSLNFDLVIKLVRRRKFG